MKKYPFKFLDSYNREDRGIFFGRDEEINALYDMVFQSSVILIYGASGTGKTSLINCGLAGKFQPHDWLALMIRRGNNINDSLEKALNDAGGKATNLSDNINWFDEWSDAPEATVSLSPVGRSIKAVYQKSFRPVYLIFDQFEELFILGSIKEQENFIKTVQDILRSEQPVKLIFSMREEYLGHLFGFERAVPQLLRKKLRVEPMNLEKVKQVIVGAAAYENSNISIKPGESGLVAEGIFEKIKGKGKSLTVQLPFLQVFLDKFYFKITGDETRTAEAEFNIASLNAMGEIGDILIDFLEEQVAGISEKLKDNYPALTPEMVWQIISPFSTLEGTKEPISKKDLYDRLPLYDAVLIDNVVDTFINSRILRYNESTDMFEVAHDSLAKPIAEKRSIEENALLEIKRLIKSHVEVKEEAREYFTEKQLLFIEPYLEKFKVSDEEQGWIAKSQAFIQNLKESEKKKREEELVKTRKRLQTVLSILVVALLALIAAGYFGYKVDRANNKAQSFTLATFAAEQLDKNPTFAIRLAELAWQKSPAQPPSIPIQRTVSKVFYESLDSKKLFYTNNLVHVGPISSAVFSPNGKKIVTASEDNTAKLWNAESGKEIANLFGHGDIVYSAVFSPVCPDDPIGGKKIVTASGDGTAKIWDAVTGKELHTLAGHDNIIYNAAFSPDGKKIVTASVDNTAKIWDADSGILLNTLYGHEEEIYTAEFSPDGKKIVTASRDKTAKIWDVETGEELHTLEGHENTVYSAVFSPACADDPIGGKMIVTASRDKTAKIWDVATGKEIQSFTGHESDVNSALFSPDGKRILTASVDKTAKIWDIETGNVIQPLIGHEDVVFRAIFSPDGKRIVTASSDKTAKIWDAETGSELFTLLGHEGLVNKAVFSPDGKKIVTASGDKSAKIWISDLGNEFSVLAGHKKLVYSSLFSPDGKKIITASADNTARIWDAKSGKEIFVLKGHESNVNSAVFSPACHDDPAGGKKIVTASWDNTAKIWDAETGKEINTLSGHSDKVTNAVFSPDGKKILTASDDKTVKIWDAETGKELHSLIGHEKKITTASFSPACPDDPIGGKMIITGSDDNTAKIWDTETGNEIYNLTGHFAEVVYAVFSPDGKKIVTASWDNTAKIWDVETGKEIHSLIGHDDFLNTAVFSPACPDDPIGGKKIVTTSWDNTAKIWNEESGKEILTLKGHDKMVNTAMFSPSGDKIVTASADKTAKIWDTESGIELYSLTGHTNYVYSAVFSPACPHDPIGGKMIVTASNDNTAMIWRTAGGIIDWLNEQNDIYKLTKTDMETLGIDFIDLEK